MFSTFPIFLGAASAEGGHGALTVITDLGAILVVAAVAAIVFFRLRLPVIFGYLLAGILVGPNLFPDLSPIQDLETVKGLSELGVIFLLFFIGLEFDIRRLNRVMVPAVLALLIQTVTMLVLGTAFASAMGWDAINSIFLGCILSISSTMVTVRVLRDQGRMDHPHAQFAIGILILEDILAVVMLAVLSGVAVTQNVEFGAVWPITFGIGVFVVAVYWVGKIVAPWLVDLLNDFGSVELVTIFSVALVLGISMLAQRFDFSVALGAFLAGAILSQSKLAHEIEEANRPLHDLFSAVFFVSVGMLIDPFGIFQAWPWILALGVLVVILKIGTVWLGLYLGGQPTKASFSAGVAKSQIGEFSFIIAELAYALEVADSRLLSVAAGVALTTILATPFLSTASDSLFRRLAGAMPRRLVLMGNFYRNTSKAIARELGGSVVLRLIRRPALQIILYFFLLNAIVLLTSVLGSALREHGFDGWPLAALWAFAAVSMAPFLIASIRNAHAIVMVLTEAMTAKGVFPQLGEGRLRNLFHAIVVLAVLLPTAAIYFTAASRFFPGGIVLGLFLLCLAVSLLFFWRSMIELNSRLEFIFMESFNAQVVDLESERRKEVLDHVTRTYPWPADVAEVEVLAGTRACGRNMANLNLRNITGCAIVGLSRGEQTAFDPAPGTPLFAHDRLVLLGRPEQINHARRFLGESDPEGTATCHTRDFHIERVYLASGSRFDGDTLAGCQLRKRFGINVVGIQRDAEQITAPGPEQILRGGDVLMVIGEPQAVSRFSERAGTAEKSAAG